MAGDTNLDIIYDDISNGKVLNKQGLLELSGQIKGYINTNIPQAYTLPTATTSTLGGVKVDGETITIEDGVISATGGSSGGATYTAGSGINIDENNVISNNIFHLIAVMAATNNPFSDNGGPFNYNDNLSFVQSYGNTLNHDGMVQLLKQHKIVFVAQSPYASGGGKSLLLHQNDFLNDGAEYMPYIGYTEGKYIGYGNMSGGYIPQTEEYLYWDGGKLHVWKYAGNIIRHMKINSNDTLGRAIDNINTRIPVAPTTDGDYILKVSVSSGAPTYSWVAATIGGSY